MYHHPKPFFRKSRGLWYVQLAGKQFNLGADRDEAFRQYHELMGQPEPEPHVASSFVVDIVDAFLDWCQKNRSPDTYRWYYDRLQLFAKRYPDLQISQLRPWHVQQWYDSYEHLASGSKHNLCRSIQRAMRWAEELRYIDRSPLADMKKPKAGRRKTVIDEPEFEQILANAPNEAFRDLVQFAWYTGARAAECVRLEARHVDLRARRIVFPVDEEKMEREPRIIYLTQDALDIIRRRLSSRTGYVFTNRNGRPWTPDAVNCAFEQVCIRLGKQVLQEKGLTVSNNEIEKFIPTLKRKRRVDGNEVDKTQKELQNEANRKLSQRLAKRFARRHCLTEIRHSWCHHALRRGVDALTVSVLMGHADPSMVSRVYSHLNHAPDYLMEQAQRAVG